MKNNYEIFTKSSISDFNKSQWELCNTDGNIFFSYNFLYLLEKSKSVGVKSGWIPLYFGIKKKKKLLAVAPSFIKLHSQGEFVFDHAWAQAYKSLNMSYYPKLLIAPPFTPATGMRILIAPDDKESMKEDIKKKLINHIKIYCKNSKLSSIHINFFDLKELQIYKKQNFIIRYGEQFHFTNKNYRSFNDFLNSLSYKSRKKIIKERKSIQQRGVNIEVLYKTKITRNDCERMYDFYISTINKKWSYDYLSKEFFSELPKYLGNNIILILAKYRNQIIGGALNFLSNNVLYGRYWGTSVDISNLHFEVCYYKAIEVAINNSYLRVEAGAQGAHKIKRGYLPTITYSAHYIFNETLKIAINKFAKAEKKAVLEQIDYINKNYSPYKSI